MKLTLSLLVPLLIAAITFGCDRGENHEAVADAQVATLRKLVDVVKGIKDEESAKAARPKLLALKKETDELKAKADKLGAVSAATDRRMTEKHEKELQRLQSEMQVEMMRIIQDPNLAPHAREAFQGL